MEKDKVIAEDMAYIRRKIGHLQLDGSRVMISGATGLVGKYLVRYLAEYCGCKVLAVVRDRDKAYGLWKDLGDKVAYICTDIMELEALESGVDYMIHGASMTSSRSFTEQPVEVIRLCVEGTQRMLEAARRNPVKGFLFLSTMEVYGSPMTDEKIAECHGTDLDTMSVRSSYPESKRLCESLCTAYFSEYGVPSRIVRLTQTFGPGVAYDDPRVFAEFARCALEGRDIVLHTKGETRRNYLYLADACTAILTVLAKGEDGEAYNAANESSYCSIRDMAEVVARQCASPAVSVRIEAEGKAQERFGYAPILKMNLDTCKLQRLGWKPEVGLVEMYQRMMESMADDGKGKGRCVQNI